MSEENMTIFKYEEHLDKPQKKTRRASDTIGLTLKACSHTRRRSNRYNSGEEECTCWEEWLHYRKTVADVRRRHVKCCLCGVYDASYTADIRGG